MNITTHIVDLHTCIQGEGKYAGIPHILIRLSGCNLNCQFKETVCDTSYASWRPEKGKYTLADVEKIISENPQIRNIFITGGEPTIYPNEIEALLDIIKKEDYFVSVETNGTNLTDERFDFLSISPKLSNSTPLPGTIISDGYINITVKETDRKSHENKRVNIPVLKQLIQNFMYQLKFVVSTENDLNEIISLQHQLHAPAANIYLMPEGIEESQLNEKRKWLMELCVKTGYNYTDRLHILAYGNKREA